MSGGSMNYFFGIMEQYCDKLRDTELVDLAHDMAKLFHDREWLDSGDYGEGDWNESVLAFKKKWFKSNREDRIEKYIDDKVSEMKAEFGMGKYCKDCGNFDKKTMMKHGSCSHKKCLMHVYDTACEYFKEKEQ